MSNKKVDVKWIKIKIGMFEGFSFKKIKRAKIDGVADFRDKLTAVWFEILDLGGKVNNIGYLGNSEIAFRTYEEIAIALDRSEKEIELCMNFYLENQMMEIIDDIFLISNWAKYQNVDGMEKIREQNRIRQENYRKRQIEQADNLLENNTDNVSVTLRNAKPLIEEEEEEDLEKEEEKDLESRVEDLEIENNKNKAKVYNSTLEENNFSKIKEEITLDHVEFIFKRLKLTSDPQSFYDYYKGMNWRKLNGITVNLENLVSNAKAWEVRELKFKAANPESKTEDVAAGYDLSGFYKN